MVIAEARSCGSIVMFVSIEIGVKVVGIKRLGEHQTYTNQSNLFVLEKHVWRLELNRLKSSFI